MTFAGWGPCGSPRVARLYHRCLALCFLFAFVSLATQVEVLHGEHGLVPLDNLLEAQRTRLAVAFFDQPSVFYWGASDTWLVTTAWIGAALAVASLVGITPRILSGVMALLYLSYVGPGQPFLSFQWDNLLVECGLLAVLLPRDRPSRAAALLFAALALKLYVESAVAKYAWGGPQWRSGEAMMLYYETAPIPTALAWYAHHLPAWWHRFEALAIVAIEFAAPFALFGPRMHRLTALVVLTGFQIVNIATANYGFFVALALALHVFALDDADLSRFKSPRAVERGPWRRRVAAWALGVYAIYWLVGSVIHGIATFDRKSWVARLDTSVSSAYTPWRSANAYHLFGPITPHRDEVEFQVLVDERWQPLRMHYKAGPLDRGGPFVAPHQPRVDFQLWFYGLSYRRRTPGYVRSILARLCADPAVVQPLFVDAIPKGAQAVRMQFHRYHFTSARQRERTSNVWRRELRDESQPTRCQPHRSKHGG